MTIGQVTMLYAGGPRTAPNPQPTPEQSAGDGCCDTPAPLSAAGSRDAACLWRCGFCGIECGGSAVEAGVEASVRLGADGVTLGAGSVTCSAGTPYHWLATQHKVTCVRHIAGTSSGQKPDASVHGPSAVELMLNRPFKV